jgi:hypothetical protein
MPLATAIKRAQPILNTSPRPHGTRRAKGLHDNNFSVPVKARLAFDRRIAQQHPEI